MSDNDDVDAAATSGVNRRKEKLEEIKKVLSAPEVDLWKLREFALTEDGLLNGTSYCCFCVVVACDVVVIVYQSRSSVGAVE